MRDIEKRLKRLDNLAFVMENLVPVPGTTIRIGVDPFLGFLPVVGDIVAIVPASYIINEARRMGVSRRLLIRMSLNVTVDAVIGMVPFVGDIFDIGWNANTRNVALLRRHLEIKAAHVEHTRTALIYDPELAEMS